MSLVAAEAEDSREAAIEESEACRAEASWASASGAEALSRKRPMLRVKCMIYVVVMNEWQEVILWSD